MASLAERAHAAAAFIRHHNVISLHGPYRAEEHARTAVRLAAGRGHGGGPDTTPGEPILATATCPDTGETYTFLARSPLYDDAPFELLGPCPECAGTVPLAEIRHLADLGTHLAYPPLKAEEVMRADTLPDTFTRDEGHTCTCSYGETL